MVKNGMMIADRYEILDKIGTGGTSDVYKARDHKLNRPVAMKILKQEFSENTSFVQKFRTEAQAAAGLMHANIVNVYDVGEENGIYYIVMELVEGITLKRYIEKKGKLSVKEAVSIAIQVSLGIDAAHKNRIVHRDIKPQNIIISKEGRVKVTDFGIAKATTSNTVSSTVMGSVHYTSPEQAKGGYSDGKSDIYSLGITLYEMLTGQVPFDGETTVSVALKHIQEPMPTPVSLVPDIPYSVEQIVLKCTQKSPSRRYQNMDELVADLKQSLTDPNGDFVKLQPGIDKAPAAKVQKKAPVAPTPTQQPKNQGTATGQTDAESGEGEGIRVVDPSKKGAAHRIRTENPSGERPERKSSASQTKRPATNGKPVRRKRTAEEEEEYEDRTERFMTTAMVFIVVIIGLIALFFIAKLGGFFDAPKTAQPTVVAPQPDQSGPSNAKTVEVKNVVNMTEAAGKVELKNSFEVEVEYVESDTVAAGRIISQSVEGGERLAVGSTIVITVSLGNGIKETTIPKLLGLNELVATERIENANLMLGEVSHEYNDEYPAGQVCSINYPTDQLVTVPEGTVINLVISDGPDVTLYYYDLYVTQPEDYTGGEITITLKGDDTQTFFKEKNPTFPYAYHVSGIANTSEGYVRINYYVTDEYGNQAAREIRYNVTFTLE